MKQIITFGLLSAMIVITMLYSCRMQKPAGESQSSVKESANSNLVDITFKVEGMDSVSINKVQDALSKTAGITRNFACWSDTVVFVEYDMSVITRQKIIEVIKSTGFNAVEKKTE
jgi:copper chaperone CopZ